MPFIFFKSLIIFLLVCNFTFFFVDYGNFTKVFKKYLLSIKDIIKLTKNSKNIDINLLKEKLDNITKNGSNLIINIIKIALPFIVSFFSYRFIGLDLSIKYLILISSIPYFIFFFK